MVIDKMTSYKQAFLWLPKKINGKWHWLTRVTIIREYQTVCIGSDISNRLVKETYTI